MAPTNPYIQGRLLDPNMSLGTDPRVHPGLLPLLKQTGMANIPTSPLDKSATLEQIGEMLGVMEEVMANSVFASIPLDGPSDSSLPEIARSEEDITGVDGNTIKLYIYRPTHLPTKDPIPCIVRVHGGGMVATRPTHPAYVKWSKLLAGTGCLVVDVDFRNGWTKEKFNPFPAGLNDCASAVNWVHSNKEKLGVNKIVLHGESGGGNLVIATALKAKKEGWIQQINGVYSQVPYISGAYNWSREKRLEELPSLVECDGYVLLCALLEPNLKVYDPTGEHSTNPLAWPYHAAVEDLKGLPPFVVSVNELDPLRDEGVAFYRKLIAAEVKAVGKINLGLPHGIELFCRAAIPDVSDSIIASIKSFVDSV